jgi:hypothetical protein
MKALIKAKEIKIDAKEHFVKQSFRNRCIIYGANGRLPLIIPLKHEALFRTPMSEIQISEDEPWKKIHWRSITSAYRKSPFFEYYEDDLEKLFLNSETKLFNFNLECLQTIFKILKAPFQYELTDTYVKAPVDTLDLRDTFHTKKTSPLTLPRYFQVFEDQHGFLSDLSVLDLICNLGPESLEYLSVQD